MFKNTDTTEISTRNFCWCNYIQKRNAQQIFLFRRVEVRRGLVSYNVDNSIICNTKDCYFCAQCKIIDSNKLFLTVCNNQLMFVSQPTNTLFFFEHMYSQFSWDSAFIRDLNKVLFFTILQSKFFAFLKKLQINHFQIFWRLWVFILDLLKKIDRCR